MVKQVFVSSIRMGWWSPMTSHVVWIGLQPAIALSHNVFFLLVYPNEMRFQWAKWSYFVEVGNPSRRQTHIYIYTLYNPHLATRTAILTVHEDARWWSARNLCGRFLSADLPPLGTKSAICHPFEWDFPLLTASIFLVPCRHKKLSPCVPWKPWMYCNSSTSWWWEPWRCSPFFCEQQGTWTSYH